MKFTVTMKTPDALQMAMDEAVNDAVGLVDSAEREDERERLLEEADRAARRWFRYGECLTVEIDTEAGTCVVKETGR